MTVDLPPQLEAMIREKIETGPYHTVGEVIAEALSALEERERLYALRAKVRVGLDQLERGEGIPFTPEWRAERLRIAACRAEAGETPNPDVCPYAVDRHLA